MLPELASDAGYRDRKRLLTRITTLPIIFLTGAKFSSIRSDGIVIINSEGEEMFIHADTVVFAMGMKPVNQLLSPLRAAGFETHIIGDCLHVGKIFDAVGDGYRLGCLL